MYFDGFPTKGVCPARGAHEAAGFNFVVPHLDDQTANFDSGPVTSDLPLGGSVHLVMRLSRATCMTAASTISITPSLRC
jgi:hypothetical protein